MKPRYAFLVGSDIQASLIII